MSKVRFELNRSGMEAFLKGQDMQNLVNGVAERMSDIAGEEYEARKVAPRRRAVAFVVPATTHAYYSNRKHGTLEKVKEGYRF